MKINPLIALTAGLMLALGACADNDGPAERLGESIDDATADMRDAADDIGNEVEDACEETKKAAGAKDTDC